MKHYSVDFRLKVVNSIQSGNAKPSQIARTFNISRNTIWLWTKQYNETGSLASKPGIGKGTKPKIDDLVRFQKIVDENPGATQAELGKIYGNASQSTVARAIKKIGYTRKKRTCGYNERNETKRKAFSGRLKKVDKKN
ncbi:MAG: IS630 transposase-related protein [Spirochaetota bacterium]